jgi:DNA-directed RNA polymerase beta' subunit
LRLSVELVVDVLQLIMEVSLSFISCNDIRANTSFSLNERFDLHDERFGSVRTGSKCVVCNKTESGGCYGHHGRLYLGTNIFHSIFLDEISKALNDICHKCGNEIEKKEMSNKRGGKCIKCGETVYVDYFIPPSQPYVAKRRNAPGTTLDPFQVKAILLRNKHRAAKFIIDCIAIPPTGIRPPEDVEWPTELSRLYIRLVDLVKSSTKTEAYQRNITNLYNSIVGYLKKDGVIAAISGKYGIFRNLMLGKRLNRSVRLVIAGDPNLDIDEILVPRSVTERVRVPEKVWNGNVERMKGYARNGQLWYASEDVQVEEDEVIVGQVYDRVLHDGDWVMLNRQPSLSKTSLLAMRVKVGMVENNIFMFNPCITTAFNADFDGDEMNIYTGYGLEAIAELKELCHVNRNIYDPLTGKVFIQPIQDAVTGMYLMTKRREEVARDLFDDCTMLTKRRSNVRDTYSLFSLVLPDDMNFTRQGMKVENGMLASGIVCKKMLNALIVAILQQYDDDTCATFIKQVQTVALRWMRDKGFTIKLRDCVWNDDDLNEYKERAFGVETHHNVSLLQSWVVNTSLSKYVPSTSDNPLAVMLHSGAKGKDIGPSQMAVSVGQQYTHGGMVRTRMKKNSPHDTGFVSSGYVKGLNAKEYFSQASASLGGIIDIGVGVSAIGYTNRRVTKLMAGVEMGYNGGISTDGQIVRF